ncbi:purine hydroxylase delta subunit apoprotein [Dethiosulfatibacter aminovorans DSM 17477]|uniref:Purine hydroxylase delta subunit apoprotein n=1 Tax=Dethiosulfatibacter aminovorans DSM 17477 TaxID=1121476 RepID=A0A1M6A7G3_9FIRM|nr:(2Fe-2S)-binding protein [Dethiosulfatibacter aminovorans]SHI32083.1 purine hydroxylase delta subunit apoprotein [Dethiosulfatibacter aminovorans DSM 17477]
MEKINISFILNGENVTVETYSNKRLVDLLRIDLGMTSVKEGCSEGECGACTVILDDEAVTSCTVLAPQVEGRKVTTIEGLSVNGELDRLQETFMEKGAVQCGYCTPGMILSAKALLMNNPNPSKEEIKTAVEGNLCRCTGYTKIIEAVEAAIE